MYCANLKEVQRMSQQFINTYGLKVLREDYEAAVKNSKAKGVKQYRRVKRPTGQGIKSYGVVG